MIIIDCVENPSYGVPLSLEQYNADVKQLPLASTALFDAKGGSVRPLLRIVWFIYKAKLGIDLSASVANT
jgi:hypothetical protein